MQGYGSQNTNPQIPQNYPLGSLMGAGGDFLGAYLLNNANYTNPANAAYPFLNQMPRLMQSVYGPYMNAGQNAMGALQGQYGNLLGLGSQLQGQSNQLMGMLPQLQSEYGGMSGLLPQVQGTYSNLMNNPGNVVNQIGQSFHQSPGYQFQTQQALNAANEAAAAGGMLGSPQEQQNIASTVNNLANQDYYNYLNTATNEFNQGLGGAANMGMQGVYGQQGLYNTGLGLGQNLYGMGMQGLQGLMGQGFNASNEYGNSLGNMLNTLGALGYAGQANQNQFNGQQAGGLANLIGSGLGQLGNAVGGAGGFGNLWSMLGL